jgi:plasmid rolling circle replication initiator protein Rep
VPVKTDIKNTDVPILHDESLSLTDLSPKDKPWDKHRSNSDRVANHYAGSDFHRYSERMTFCSELLDFKLTPSDDGSCALKLSSARFCRVRHCPVCQWRRSLAWKAKAYKVLPLIVEQYPKHRWLFLTLTIKNCKITELRETIGLMNKSFKRLIDLKVFPAVGWLKSVEVTRGRDGSAHPHFHCLLMVPSGYFSGRDYLKQAEWVAMWRKCLRLDYDPVLDVQAIKKGSQPMQLIPELLKYCTKESDMTVDREWLLELTRQMHKLRAIATGGVLKVFLKALEEEPEDLIHVDGEEKADSEDEDPTHLYFGWKYKEKKYRLLE